MRLTDGKQHVFLNTAERHGHPLPRGAGPRRWAAARAACAASPCAGEDKVVGMEVVEPESAASVVTVCERGYGKRTAADEYRVQNRGGSGLITIKTTERNGKVVGLAHGDRRRRAHAHHRRGQGHPHAGRGHLRRSAATPRACGSSASTRTSAWWRSRRLAEQDDEGGETEAQADAVISASEQAAELEQSGGRGRGARATSRRRRRRGGRRARADGDERARAT